MTIPRDEILCMALQADCLHVDLTGDQAKGLERLGLFSHAVIEDFLTRSGQYLTNDVSREAAIAEAVAVEREACAHAVRLADNGTEAAAIIRARGP